MAHALEVVENKAAFAFREKGGLPWHGLGQPLPDNATTEEVLAAAHLAGWDVRLEPVKTDARTDKEYFEVLRTNPFDGGLDQLAIVGSRYMEVQNETVAEFAANIVDGGAMWETAGSILNGRRAFFALELEEDIVLDPNGSADKIGRYITVETSHDGTSAVYANTSNVRVVCQNTLMASKSAAMSTFKVRHTQSVEGRLEDARKALSIAFKQGDVLAKELQDLIEEEFTKKQFFDLVKDIYPKPERDVRGSVKKWENKTDVLMDLWNGNAEGGNTVENLEDTKYKAYNVLNEHLLWYPQSRSGNYDNLLIKASGMDDQTNKRNVELFRAVVAA